MRSLSITLPDDLANALRRFKADALTDMTDEQAVIALLRDALTHQGELEQFFDLEDAEAEGSA